MTSKSGQNGDMLEDKSRRDFARTALAAGGAMLITPKLMAATQASECPAQDPATIREIYRAGNGNFMSKYVYVYRILPDGILAYYTERKNTVSPAKMESEEIDNIIAEIKDQKIKPAGFGLGDIRWRRRSYLLISYEAQGGLERGNAITFNYLPEGGAHTFRDGKDILTAGVVRRFFCANRMEKKGGGDVGSAGEDFFIMLNHTHRPTTRGHNDTGTNTGPPLP